MKQNEIGKMKIGIVIYFFAFAITSSSLTEFLQEPHLQTIDGHLYIYGANDKNVSFVVSPKGYVNVNGENLHKVVAEAKQAATSIFSLKYTMLTKLEEDIKYVTLSMDQMSQKMNVCETFIQQIAQTGIGGGGGGGGGLPFQYLSKINKLERRVKTIMRNLAKQECDKDPCLNGGICHDKYLDYECRCLEGWEGKKCEKDVNECAKFAGSDLGCQNGATCINKPGSYECVCAPGWYGLHCMRRSNDCSSAPASELCGHGICVTQTTGNKGFTCICDQGWKTDGINPACSVDVDECTTFPCSRNPLVTCHNTPGNFFCGPCPHGYTGNGFACTDINECLVQNGGCSTQPMVQCINTEGSSTCGPCPPGYVGDGKTCTFVGKCNVNNGGCNPNAKCEEVGNSIQCQCLPGYSGTGIGPYGCEPSNSRTPGSENVCNPNPCKNNGRCFVTLRNSFTCLCQSGFTGQTCSIARNSCSSNPCQNGGTCMPRGRLFFCKCTSAFTGKYCQRERQGCGGYLSADEGELQFPPANSSSTTYSHNLSCAWIIMVNNTLAINVTFEYFDLELAPECEFDWVQIHDGKSAGDHIIGKFCGDSLPNNGTIISTSNFMYMWFKSDGSKSKNGFKLSWKAVNPVCGGTVNASIHGTIRSPGSPGKYPPNRDCFWHVTAPLGHRITFTFFEVHIETHPNCSFDYLEFYEGLTLDSPLLGRYCNSSIPQPLITPGNTALVYFHSDQYQSDRGFQIAFHPTPGYPGCGGIFTNRRGEISPPMEEGRYMKNMDCAWLIRLSGNLRIGVEFTTFKLEEGTNCNNDFVEFREGSDISSPLIGRYCGFVAPPPIKSEGNVLFVRFYSDSTIESTGFRLSYKAVCSETFTGDTGVIQSPGYPVKYKNQEDCVFIVEQPPGKIIELEFQDFEFESISSMCAYDYLEIRDGHSEDSPLIKRFCGLDRPPRIVSTHNYLWIKMVTDKDIEMRGFYANYTTTDIFCGGIFTAAEGIIQIQSGEGTRSPDRNCRWVIAGKVGEVVQLTFTSFSLTYDDKCKTEYMEIYDNSSVPGGGGLIGRFCGPTVPPLMTTTDNVMTIIYHSDYTFSSSFSASYKLINVSTICGGNYFTNVGVIKSPNYPKLYPNGKTCVWVIRVAYGNRITLKASTFILENQDGKQCTFDYLEVRDGGYESSPLIGRYCGMKFPKRIVSQSNVLYLKFKTDNYFSSFGFRLTWDGSLTGCGGTLTAMSGSIISPNYPEPYGGNSLCIYKIIVASGSKVSLNVMDLDLQSSEPCTLDYIEVFDGSDKSGKSLGKLCSINNHPPRLSASSNQMTIVFKSNVLVAGKGFFLKYTSECNMNITGYRGVIESPNYPDKIPPGTNCTWIITAPMGNKINMSFSHFNFLSPCQDNFIEVQEGNSKPTNTIGKYCLTNKPLLLSSSLQKVFIKLTSAQDILYGNFRMEWVVNGCGGTFIKKTGKFQSPNYPKLYPPNTLCEYFITVDPSLSIMLQISNINMEALVGCFGDYLAVYGGSDDTAPLLVKLCQKKSEIVAVHSSGNKMYVKFLSDSVTEGTGFVAWYYTQPAECGGLLKSNQGRIHSRNYPKNYNTMDNCEWTIQVDQNHKIRLTFEDFDLASDTLCNDTYIEVFDGPSTNSPLLMKHCGSTIPKPNPLFSSTNILTVHMRTDQGFTAKGFSAQYEMECGANIVVDEPGEIRPSNYLDTRDSQENCTWILTAPEADGHVTVTVTISAVFPSDFGKDSDDGCTDNTLFVYDGKDHNATLLGAYCNRKSHLPVTSSGNVIFLELYKNIPTDMDFWATYSSESSACGGVLRGESGSFASPGYPGSFSANLECIWTITSAPGNAVELSFQEFDIEESEHCNEEYVEIREKDGSGKMFGVFCGQNTPANLTSSNQFWIKFRSSKLGTGRKGFLADYSPVYNMELNGTSGKIANPSFPRPFIHFVDSMYWRVKVAFGSSIRVNFKVVQLDELSVFVSMTCTSWVSVYDGYDDTAPELVKACGMVKPDPVTSSSNVVYIQFSHLQVLRGSLFLLEWSEVPSQLPTSAPPGFKCGNQTDLSQNMSTLIQNPGWPEPYGENENCEWLIQCPYHEHLVLTVHVMSFPQNYHCNYIYLGVQSKTVSDEWEEKRRLCLSNETDQTISTSNYMKLFLQMSYSSRVLFSVDVHRECGNSISRSDGVIKFNWKNYTNYAFWSGTDYICQWDITVGSGKTIAVVFTEFDFGSSENSCRDKYIMLRNGGLEDSPVLGRGVYCTFPSLIPHTTSNRLYIKAKSSYRDASFVLKFNEVSPTCGQRVKLDENFNVTIISSPNYPNIPPSKIECVWTFVTTGEHRIQIDFLERFDLTNTENCEEEYLEIRDGGTVLSEELGRFCSTKPSTQKSSGNMLFVKYYTNSTNPKNGFKAQVSLARCGGIIRSGTGFITSPNYPGYLYDTECRWEIEVDDDYKVQVSFADLDLPLNSTDAESTTAKSSTLPPDFNQQRWMSSLPNKNQTNCTSSALISIFEPGLEESTDLLVGPKSSYFFRSIFGASLKKLVVKKKEKLSLLGFVCNNDPVIPIRTSANRMVIEFQSGQARRNSPETPPRGFKLNFTNAGRGCSQRLDTPNGVITSPGYPGLRPDHYFCTWKIRTTKGRRVTLKVEDFDLPVDTSKQRVMFYNDLRARSLMEVVIDNSPAGTLYKSTSNQMLVTYWSPWTPSSTHRGFKFSYNSDEAEICGGVVTDESGIISSPSNMSSFFCRWEFISKKQKNRTVAFYVKDAVISKLKYCTVRSSSVLAITSKVPGKSSLFKYEMCGNITEEIIRNPIPTIKMIAIKGIGSSNVSFNVTYKTFNCGGIISDIESEITSPNYPNNYPPDTDCAWLINVPNGQTLKLTFSDFSLQPSCEDYLTVRNGPSAKSPLIGQYCGTSLDAKTSIQSEGSSLFVEFHSDSKTEGKGFKIGVEPANYVCGGAIHSKNYEIMSPNFPSEYGNNQECEWELISVEGTHIGLVFRERFHIESSENCQNDFVKVYDFVDGDWKLLKTLCGREMPEAINSTSNRLKILFRSNTAITSDGFKANWYQNCGGVLTSTSGVIRSPGYPDNYPNNLNCTYIIDPRDENVFLNFTSFSLEPPYQGRCQFDGVTISEEKYHGYDELVGIFCGSQMPGFKIFRNKIKINFFTDSDNSFEGFVMNFNTTGCGGLIKAPSVIGYVVDKKLMDLLGYDYGTCTWDIEAPANKIIVLRFDMVNIPLHSDCVYPYIDVSENKSNKTVLLAKLCGQLAPRQVVLKSTTNKVTVNLQKPTVEAGGFYATVFFTYGTAAGCGGEVSLGDKPETIQSPDVNGDGLYEEYMDCTWVIRAKPFHQIEANFKSFEVHPCKKFNGTNLNESCQCDYVELRDGGDHHSEVLLFTCGSSIPPSVTSSGSVMFLRLSTDGTYNSRGFAVKFSSKLSQCGVGAFQAKDEVQTLTSPNYPNNYQEGLNCKWFISNDTDKSIHLHLVEWDIEESPDCKDDYLFIEDTGNFKPLYQINEYSVTPNKSEGTGEIIRGNPGTISHYDKTRVGRTKFCGKGNSIDFYSETKEVTVGFVSNSGRSKKGFRIEYSIAGCTRNYTAEHGRIKNVRFMNTSHCYMTITAPSPNHTISLYFEDFIVGRGDHGSCPSSYLEVRDGPDVKSPLIEKFCGYRLPNPLFSSGQYLWIHLYTVEQNYQRLDITYTTTDKGKGCGGRLFGLSGIITSPGYPSNVRQNSVCRWDITVPSFSEEILKFDAFDIGPASTCNTDYIEFYEVTEDTEILLSRFCGKDTPATIRSTANSIAIKYHTSLHNGGTGWKLAFRSAAPGVKFYEM